MNKCIVPETKASFQFAGKGMTLENLAPHLTTANLCDQIIVSTLDWRHRRDELLAEITGQFATSLLAIRSSAAGEDGTEFSAAGVHLSRTDVRPTEEAVGSAIDAVFESYTQSSDHDQVLVQPMVKAVVISGVVLTRDLDNGSPYYVVNYDDFTGRTDTVTGGSESKTILVHRSRPDALRSSRFRKLIDSAIELEEITGNQELDIEFCITEKQEVYILQVRPLAARHHWEQLSDTIIDKALDNVRACLADRMKPQTGLAGNSTILGEMSDWNPAEMIGNAPRPLALSLYKSLITNHIWAEGRARMGYRRVDEPLLVDFCGRPFIDVRLSLNSFLPADINEGIAIGLVNYQLARLAELPNLHDKIEFEIAVTCRDFSFNSSIEPFRVAGVNDADLKAFEDALARLTHSALKGGLKDIDKLVGRSRLLLSNNIDGDFPNSVKSAQSLFDKCKTLGTLPFSQLARHGFIGILFLRSLVERQVFAQEDADRFMRGIHTIARKLVFDMHAVANGTKSKKTFLSHYGHLRPATYDILSSRYDERPDLYLGTAGREPPPSSATFALSAKQNADIGKLLRELRYDVTPEELLVYIAAAIKAREEAKFSFSRSISDALLTLTRWGEKVGLSPDEISFVPIDNLLDDRDTGFIRAVIQRNREAYRLTRAIRLPHLIREPADIDVIQLPLGQPNFITSKRITAKTIHLTSNFTTDIDGFIVLIESADPGFDWIFAHQIAGLVTKYGGPNSHMAIRCAEFGLPAAIGCGERLFSSLTNASVIELNCAARRLGLH